MPNYKLVSFQAANGVRAGVVVDERVFELAALTGITGDASIRGLLADWPAARVRLTTALSRGPRGDGIPLAQAKLLAPVLYPSAIY